MENLPIFSTMTDVPRMEKATSSAQLSQALLNTTSAIQQRTGNFDVFSFLLHLVSMRHQMNGLHTSKAGEFTQNHAPNKSF